MILKSSKDSYDSRSEEFRKIHPTAFSNVQGFCTWENQSNTV